MITKNQNKKFTKILKWVLKNPNSHLYKKKYKSLKDLQFQSLPFLTRQELTAIDPGDLFFVPLDDISTINSSSGTTSSGNPLLIPKMVLEDPAVKMWEKLLDQIKVKKLMVLSNISVANNRLSYIRTHPKSAKKRAFILGDIHNFNLSALMISKLSIDAIETTSTVLSLFIPFLKEVYDLNKIKFIGMGGEYVSEQKYSFLKSYFKNAHFQFRFGGTENPIYKGFRCQFISNLAPRFFHPNNDFYIYEVVDQDGKEVNAGERGELVLTTIKKCAFPLIRYKTGDAIIYHEEESCACGEKDLIEVFGRIGYDFVRIAGFTIHTEMLEKALAKIDPSFSNKYQLHVYEVVENSQLLPKLILHLFDSKISKSKLKIISNKIEELLYLSPSMTMKDLREKGFVLPLEIKLEKKKEGVAKSVKIVSHVS